MRRAAKKDANHSPIANDLRRLGFHIWDTAALGDGGPDLVVTGHNLRTGRTEALLAEIKTAKGKLTPDEVEFHEAYPADGPLLIVRALDDVLRWFGRI